MLVRNPSQSMYEGSYMYCRAYNLGEQGSRAMLEAARARGGKGACTSCTNSSAAAIAVGFSAAVTGDIVDAAARPQVLKNVKVLPLGAGCPGGTEWTLPSGTLCPTGTCGDLAWRLLVLHGVTMSFTFGIIVLSGVLIARFGGPRFFEYHVQLMGEVAAGPTIIGMSVAFITLETHLASLHARMGVAIMVLCVVQGWLGATVRHWATERAPVATRHGDKARKVKRGSKAHRRSLRGAARHSMFESFWCVYKRCVANVSLRRELQIRRYHRLQGYAICVAAACQIHLGLSHIGATPVFFYAYYAFLTAAALLIAKLQLARTNAQQLSCFECGRTRPSAGSESSSGGTRAGGERHGGSAALSAVAPITAGACPEDARGSGLAAGTALPVQQQAQKRQSKTVV
eukprot:g8179.t1